MKSILIEKPNQLAIVEREIPTPSAGEVRVKVKLAGICGSDSHIYRGHNPFAKYPRVIGHEFFGVIDAVGEGVESARVGERVAVDPVVSCGHCYPCSIGKPNVCTTLAVLGVHADGGFSEYAVVPAKNAWKIPEAVADQYAVMIEPFTIAANVTGHGQPTENDTVLVKEIKRGIDQRDIEKLAASIVDTLSGEHYIKAVIGIGTPIANVKDLATSFKEAQIALEVGKVFDTEQPTISYDHLGIARLIYQLPTTLCEMFLREVFKQGSIESLDSETLFTIQRFFENNLNVSETSRGLFVHRNTLVYRLEKIKKLTGLDLREFDDAIVFKVALMVRKYLDANPAKY